MQSNSTASALSKLPVVCLLATISCLLWGSAFPCVKLGYELFEVNLQHIPSILLFAGMRFTLAGILTILIGSVLSRRPLIPHQGHTFRHIMILAMLQTIIQYFFFYIGLAHTTGVKASIIGGANAFVALLIASLLFHQESLTPRKLLGCIIGFAGVVLVNLNQGGLGGGFQFTGEGFVFLSTVSAALSATCLRKFGAEDHPVLLSGWQFFCGGIVLILTGLAGGGHVAAPTPQGALMLFYLGCISAVAYSLWGILLKHNPVSRITVLGFMTPIFGVILSAVFLKEFNQAMGATTAGALLLICLSIFFVNSTSEKENLQTTSGRELP